MPNCKYCDNNLSPNATFCPKCGDDILDAEPSTNYFQAVYFLFFTVLMGYATYREDDWFFIIFFGAISLLFFLLFLASLIKANT